MPDQLQHKLGPRITPLWIVAAFVTMTETVLGYALTQVDGGVQIALTTFVISFALLVAGAFFVILWNRPYVFYPPSEYGDTDPKAFVDALRGAQPDRIREQRQLLEQLDEQPDNTENEFTIINSLVDDPVRQFMILMHEQDVKLPMSDYYGNKYDTGHECGPWASGVISGQDFAKKLSGTDTVDIDPNGPVVLLNSRGHEFAKWLVDNGHKAAYMESNFGGWGTPNRPPGFSPPFDPAQVVPGQQQNATSQTDETGSTNNPVTKDEDAAVQKNA